MSKLRVQSFAVSLDGYGAGPDQDLENPLGVDGFRLMEWFFPTRVFRRMHGGGDEGETGVDNRMAEKGFDNIGAWILGRNMFGPVRGPWPDDSWRGWWGDEPPYHVPVFVLTHHAREPLAIPSQSVRPGSSKWTCASMTPGKTCRPVASIERAAGPARSGPSATMRPSLIATSPVTTPSAVTSDPPRMTKSSTLTSTARTTNRERGRERKPRIDANGRE